MIKVGDSVKIDVTFMGENYWDGMSQDSIDYILADTDRVYKVIDADDTSTEFVLDTLPNTTFYDTELVKI